MPSARVATMDDVDHVVQVLADAFIDDPMMSWAFPDLSSRPGLLENLWRFMAGTGYLPRGHSVVAGESAALWLPSGVTLDDDFWVEHGAAFGEAMGDQVERLGAIGAAMAAHHPAEPHWYLMAIGVRSSAQGQGLGGLLLAHTLAEADAARQPAYLEASSTRSRALYERHGFVATGEFNVDDSPPLWPMWREPRPN